MEDRPKEELEIKLERAAGPAKGVAKDGKSNREARRAKRRKIEAGAFQAEKPPGAPAAASASAEVSAAVAAAAKHSGKRGDGGREGGSVASEPGGTSFGPRFKGLGEGDLTSVRSKWQLHTLAGVRTTTSEDNAKAATDFFEQMRKRKEARLAQQAPQAQQPEGQATDAAGGESEPAVASKPTFRRPAPRAEKDESAPATERADAFSTPGARTLEACVAGAGGRRRKMEQTGQATAPAALPKKRRAVCAADFEDE
ncbi:unnamed protein product [Polarella glacialis]|uniref:Uncharacterized protein n=1 Tax=Polarella glacialis TaxID=89957 RepID=A0A813H2P2_POLGL|nr:unnamed protein product [Polarella glacialis]